MNRIRIGNDIPIRWSIVTGRGDSQQPYDLTGKNLSLHVRAINGAVIPLEMTTEGNVVISTFYGKDQRLIGKYVLVLVENDHVEGMKTVDECQAFELVDCSCKQTGGESGNIETEQIDLSSGFPLLAIEVDSVLSEDSMNPIQNKAVAVAVRQLNERIDKKQDIIEDLEEIREGASKGSTAIQDVSELATKEELAEGLNTRIAKTDIVQELGYAIDRVMSQNAILKLNADLTTMIAAKLDKGVIVQSTGGAKDRVMSQSAVTDALNRKQGTLIAGDNIKIEGNRISCTFDIDIVRVVDVLPETGEENHIYLVPAEQPSESDLFEEWVWKDSWERIGSAKIDLSGYATKEEVQTAIEGQYYDATSILSNDTFTYDEFYELWEAITNNKTIFFREGNNVLTFLSQTISNESFRTKQIELRAIGFDQTNKECISTFTLNLLESKKVVIHQQVIPANISDLDNDSGFITTSEVYTKIETDEKIDSKQDSLTDTDGSYGQRVAELEDKIGEGSQVKMMTEMTHAELVALRDSSSLVPGMQYRITDYEFTTTEEETSSSGKQFDIIVTADNANTLNENARAINHAFETTEEILSGAIKLYKTSINDFPDEVDTGDYFLLSGKVIIDGVEYYKYDKYEDDEAVGRYILLDTIDLDSLDVSLDNPLYPDGEGTYDGTGAYASHQDDAIVSYENGTKTISSIADKLISRDLSYWELKYTLDNIKHSASDGKGTILWMKDEYNNECRYDFINALFLTYRIKSCPSSPSVVGKYAIKTTNFNITYDLTDTLWRQTFDFNNHDNIIKYDGLAKIVLGGNCYYNTFGGNCYSNTFGDNCQSNTFGDNCQSNTFGNNCYSNTFGNNCQSNTFGNNCYSNTFGNNCRYIKTMSASSGSKYDYYQCNHIGNGCRYLLFRGQETASSSTWVQNYNIAQGIQGTSSAYVIVDAKRNLPYETKVALNSAGELKMYCEADLIQ